MYKIIVRDEATKALKILPNDTYVKFSLVLTDIHEAENLKKYKRFVTIPGIYTFRFGEYRMLLRKEKYKSILVLEKIQKLETALNGVER